MRTLTALLFLLALAACAPERGVGFDRGAGGDTVFDGSGDPSGDIAFEQGAPTGVPQSVEEQALYDGLSAEGKACADAYLADGSTVASAIKGGCA